MIKVRRTIKLAACALIFSWGVNTLAQQQTVTETDSREFYTIQENTPQHLQVQTVSLDGFTWDSIIRQAEQVAVYLLNWTLHKSQNQPVDKYNRLTKFGRWINDPDDKSCFNTRAEVLARDSQTPVVEKPNNKCSVDKGYWLDPYTKTVFTESKDIQIDHVVPLKNAYDSGAWKWDFQTRCLYANYTENNFHLLSVNAHENMSKGDSAPDKYLPPNKSYVCEYIRNWLAIKLIWKLTMSTAETAAMDKAIYEYGCSKEQFGITKEFLNQQRTLILKNLGTCKAQAQRIAQ